MRNSKIEKAKETLESMLDAHTLTTVLGLLVEICNEKADHIRSNYQDEISANYWNYRARDIQGIQHPC